MKEAEIYEEISNMWLRDGTRLKNCVPVPTEEERESGFMKRYFCKKKEGKFEIIEIDKDQYEEWNSNENSYNGLCYEFIEIDWKISGRKRDLLGKNGELIEPGIVDSNFRILEMAEKKVSGLAKKLNVDLKKGVDDEKNSFYLTMFAK